MNSIEVENVSKKFRLYSDKSLTLKERFLFMNRTRYEELQVLKNISFKINKGDTVGLIGKNGSGKSTLLKLLTGIIYPDKGDIKINGRVSSLLELGAGFHADFSGRENIYNNASIFGLSKQEIDDRFDRIVDFSELHDFIDNPVRTYSSGMYMRLAFSVAINVDADILLIDEILAVGDANFQKKCTDKLKQLKKSGITIVLVSHDSNSVINLCNKAIWLEQGRIIKQGKSLDIVNTYLEHMDRDNYTHTLNTLKTSGNENENLQKSTEQIDPNSNVIPLETKNRWGNKAVYMDNIIMRNANGSTANIFETGENVQISFDYIKNDDVEDISVGIAFVRRNDEMVCYGTNTAIDYIFDSKLDNDRGTIICNIDELNLLSGEYFLDLALHTHAGFHYDYYRQAHMFNVYSNIHDTGITRLNHEWYVDGEILKRGIFHKQDKLALSAGDFEMNCDKDALSAVAGDLIQVQVTLLNHTNTEIRSTLPFPVEASYHIKNALSDDILIFDGLRTQIDTCIPIGEYNMNVDVQAPDKAGEYILELTMVQEGCFWFEDVLSKSFIKNIKLTITE